MINSLLARATKGQPTPEIGMGVTFLLFSDRHPGTIVSIDKNIIGVQGDSYERVDKNGMSEMQRYEFTPNLEASIVFYRFDANKGWRNVQINPDTGRWVLSKSSTRLRIGKRSKYHDFSF